MIFPAPLLLGKVEGGGRGETCGGAGVGSLKSDTDQKLRKGQRWRNVVSIIMRRDFVVNYMLIISYPFRGMSY